MKIMLALAGSALLAAVVLTANIFTLNSRDVKLEERFLDECQWAPMAPPQPDGSVPARVARNPFPLCYLELQKAKNLTTTLQLTTPPPPPPAPTPAGK